MDRKTWSNKMVSWITRSVPFRLLFMEIIYFLYTLKTVYMQQKLSI